MFNGETSLGVSPVSVTQRVGGAVTALPVSSFEQGPLSKDLGRVAWGLNEVACISQGARQPRCPAWSSCGGRA